MKKKRINNLKWLGLNKHHYFIIFILCGIQMRCKSDRCEVIESYSNGSPKLEMCILNEHEKYYHYKEFYYDGSLKTLFYMLDEKLGGEVIEYYQAGGIKSKSIYKNGEKDGDHYEFHKDGKLDYYNYFVKNKVIYIKDYQYDLDGSIEFEEGFIPIISFKQNSDTIFSTEQSLNFDISIPLPDSIFEGRDLIYKFGIKPLSLKDSIVLDSSNKVVLDNKKTINCIVTLKSSVTQIFYGYTMDRKENRLYQPFEKTVVLLQ